jgi:S-adenosylmethionine synthetase
MMFGFACDETPQLMPLPLMLAHAVTRRLAAVRRDDTVSELLPDGKAQVTVRYRRDADGAPEPVCVERVVVSSQHRRGSDMDELRASIMEHVVRVAIPAELLDDATMRSRDFVLVNPTGRFEIGGPMGDAGLTGRKIIVDTYGGMARHGGGAFSGKDPTKVDRSAAYAARYLAKNVVAAGLADHCTIQLSYAIGVAKPLSIYVDVGNNPSKIDIAKLEGALGELMDLTPRGIRRHLDLNKPIYARTSAYGHFGREPDKEGGFSWEKTDLVDKLKSAMA